MKPHGQCSGNIDPKDRSWRGSWKSRLRCENKGTVVEDGKEWCLRHAPSTLKKKELKRKARIASEIKIATDRFELRKLERAVIDTAVMRLNVFNGHDFVVTDQERQASTEAADEAVEALIDFLER